MEGIREREWGGCTMENCGEKEMWEYGRLSSSLLFLFCRCRLLFGFVLNIHFLPPLLGLLSQLDFLHSPNAISEAGPVVFRIDLLPAIKALSWVFARRHVVSTVIIAFLSLRPVAELLIVHISDRGCLVILFPFFHRNLVLFPFMLPFNF
ncbi:hypothetical protein PFISCL1PPCAC_4631, partial [Pristionchus fissidentatus]